MGDPTIGNLRDAINSHDLDRIVSSFTEDFESSVQMHPSRSFVGNEHVRANWSRLLARVPDLRALIQRAVFDVRSDLAGVGDDGYDDRR
ncbi:hypothetical protein BE21_55195 [Sorangium cellulosum]|uniref:SnoaL-like domain-containing protein n=1 Tax=Sorangium cellulosum TaxID=56 RepID=A0A150TC15_SORCE|nr:hypothetical protein BE21_55195 [Sorangium cellulosum]